MREERGPRIKLKNNGWQCCCDRNVSERGSEAASVPRLHNCNSMIEVYLKVRDVLTFCLVDYSLPRYRGTQRASNS